MSLLVVSLSVVSFCAFFLKNNLRRVAVLCVLLLSGGLSGAAQSAHFSYARSVFYANDASTSPFGITVDSAGDVYYGAGGTVYKVTPAGTRTAIASGFTAVQYMAVDSSGNLYLVDIGPMKLFKLTLASGVYTKSTLVSAGFLGGVAVDASGNVFYQNEDDSAVIKLPAGGGAAQTLFATDGVDGLAIDGSGNLYVGDTGTVTKATRTGPGTYTLTTPITGLTQLVSIQSDASGNLYLQANGVLYKETFSGGSYTRSTIQSGLTSLSQIALDPAGDVFISENGFGKPILEINYSGLNFGPVAVASTTPASVYFTFDSATTGATPIVTAQGVSGLDFVNAGTGTCSTSGSYSTGDTCTVDVTFQPKAPGVRPGSVLLQSSGTTIATANLYGVGVAPEATFAPPVVSVLTNTGSDTSAIVTDAANNVFFADGNTILKMVPGAGGVYGTPVAIHATGVNLPTGLAIDGSGSVYVASKADSQVYRYTWDGSAYSAPVALSGLPTINTPAGLAFDGRGDLLIVDSGANTVFEMPWNGSGFGTATVVGGGSVVLNEPLDVTSDVNGNVFIAGHGDGNVVEVPPVGPATTLATLARPVSIELDPNANVYVADAADSTIYELSKASGSYGSPLAFSPTTFSGMTGIALAANGNLFISGNQKVQELDYADAPSLVFASTFQDGISASQTVMLQNFGNADLQFPIPLTHVNDPSIAAGFTLDSSSSGTCGLVTDSSSLPFTLAANTSCNLPVTFTPTTQSGSVSGSLVLTDTHLNATSAPADTQTILLSGTATAQTVDHFVVSVPNPSVSFSNFQVSVTAVDSGGNTVLSYNGTVAITTTDPSFISSGNITLSNGFAAPVGYAFKIAGAQTITATDTVNSALTGSETVTVLPGATLNIGFSSFPSNAASGTAFPVTLIAYDLAGNLTPAYAGTVHFTSTDTLAGLPADYTFVVGDAGSHTFNVTLKTPGAQTITATDSVNSFTGATGPITVTAPNFVVTTRMDDAGAASNCTPQVGSEGSDASCSLRDAVLAATSAGAGNITFSSGTFASPQTITLTNGALTLTANTSIAGRTNGVGATTTNQVTITGNLHTTNSSFFTVNAASSSVSLSNLNFSNITLQNDNIASGGLIQLNSGNLNITSCSFDGIHLTAQNFVLGGVLYGATGTSIALNGSTFSNNIATSSSGFVSGGAVAFYGTHLTATDTTFVGNQAAAATTGQGGALFVNTANGLDLLQTTIVNNSVSGTTQSGGGVFASGALVQNSIVSGNTASTDTDITAGTTNDGTNLIGGATNLSALGNFGGPTQTMLPLPGSPAICGGAVASAPGLSSDQRGFARTTTYGLNPACVDSGATQASYGLTFTSNPNDTPQNATLTPHPAVTLTENGSTFTSGSFPVTVSILAGGSPTLSGTTTQSTVNGVATFNDLSVNLAGTEDNLGAKLVLNSGLGISLQPGSNTFDITAPVSDVASLAISAPSAATAGSPLNFTVTAKDSSGNVVADYTGTVHFTSTDPNAVLPADFTFSGAGAHTLSATLKTPGTQTITVTDTVSSSLTATTSSINVFTPEFVVTNIADSGTGSLRDAVTRAATAGAGDITFDPTTFSTPQTIILGSFISVGANTTITGPSATDPVTISGGDATQLFDVSLNPGDLVTFSNLNFVHGNVPNGFGAAISITNATVTVNNGTFDSNQETLPAAGAAIGLAFGTLNISNSTFSHNILGPGTGSGQGGAIFALDGTLNINNSTFSGNQATTSQGAGGAIYLSDGSTATLVNTTVSGNSGAIAGGIYADGLSVLNLKNTIISGNAGTGDLQFTNINQDTTDIISDPNVHLSALGNFGGPTQTMLPLPTSSALCAGTGANTAGVVTDQRGLARTVTYNGLSCVDSGAVQTNYAITFGNQPPTAIQPGFTIRPAMTANVTENGTSVTGASVTLTAATGTVAGTTTVTTSAGVATFDSTYIGGGTAPDHMLATLPLSATRSLTANSNNFNFISISPTTLPDSTQGFTYSQSVTASGSAAPYTYVVESGGALPTGLSLDSSTGAIVGTTTTQGTFTFTIQATDNNGATAEQGYTIHVLAPGAASLNFTTVPATALAGSPFNVTVTAKDTSGNIVPGYTGTVHFASGDSHATLPSDYTFVAGDSGVHTFPVTLRTISTQGLSATDTVLSITAATANVFVTAPNFVVTVNTDGVGTAAHCTPQSSSTGTDASCSLRDAVTAAVAAGSANISFDAVHFGTTQTIILNSLLSINANVTITGTVDSTTGVNLITLSGNNANQILGNFSGNSLEVDNLIFINGLSAHFGAAIDTGGSLTVRNSTFQNNKATASSGFAEGGAILAAGSLTVTGSTFSGNSATAAASTAEGGAIRASGSPVTIVNSTFAGNTVSSQASGQSTGGAITLSGNPVWTLASNTIVGNIVTSTAGIAVGGGIFTTGTETMTNNIFAGNSAVSGANFGGNATTASGDGNITTGGHSFIPLGNHGGPTPTTVLVPGDTAQCGGNAALLNGLATDQRGLPRTVTYGATSCLDPGASQSIYALTFSTQPSNVTEGVAMSPAPVVTVTENGQTATVFVSPLALTLSPTGTLNGGTVTAVSGVATYNALSVTGPNTGDTLTATLPLGNGLSVTQGSNNFNVIAAIPATSLAISGAPSSAVAGKSFNVTVTATGAGGATSNNYAGTVHFSSTDAIAGLPANYTFTSADAGVHTFNITLKTAGSQTFTAADTVNSALTATSGSIAVAPPSFLVTTLNGGSGSGCVLGAVDASGGNSNCSLHDAVDAMGPINSIPGITVRFLPSLATVASPGTIHLGSTVIIPWPVTIVGPGANALTIDGGNSVQLFEFNGGDKTISGLTLSSAHTLDSGGAIAITSENVTLSGMQFLNNTANSGGAVVQSGSGTLTILGSTFIHNTANFVGGALRSAGQTIIRNSTFSLNSGDIGAVQIGGGSGHLVQNTTFDSNTADNDAALVINGSANISNSIFSNNHSTGTTGSGAIDARGVTISSSHNLFFNNTDQNAAAADCTNCAITSSVTGDPKLSPTNYYGGPVQTSLLLPGSSAFCSGDPTLSGVSAATMNSQVPDARGLLHSSGYCLPNQVDIGAVQSNYSLAFTQQPSDIVAGSMMGPAPAVTLSEQGSVFSAADGSSITLSRSTDTLSGATANTASGVATFSTFTDNTAGTGDQLIATLTLNSSSSTSVTSTSNAFNVLSTAGSATALVISAVPASTNSNAPFNITVTATGAGGTTATDYIGTVHFTSSDLIALLPDDYTFTLSDAGVHTFTGVRLFAPGVQTITATDNVTSTLTASANVTVIAPNFVVTVNTDDAGTATNCTAQTNPGTGADASCSLRDAVLAAAATKAGNITFDTTQFATDKSIALTNGQVTISSDLTITGAVSGGANLVTLTGTLPNSTTGLFGIAAHGTPVAFSNLIFANISVASGATVHGGALTIDSGLVTVSNSTFSGNQIHAHTDGAGAAIYVHGSSPSLTLLGDTFANNSVASDIDQALGGAVFALGSPLTVVNSTFTGNGVTGSDQSRGGALYATAAINISQSTVVNNTASSATPRGGGIEATGATLVMNNSIVSGNTVTGTAAGNADVAGSFTGSGNLVGGTANLSPLGNYGGFTQTIVPIPGSLSGSQALCNAVAANATGITTDQRGYPRTTTYVYNGTPMTCVDAGAVQTNFALTWGQQPSAVEQFVTMSPDPTVLLTDQGSPFAAGSVSIPLHLQTGSGPFGGNSVNTSTTPPNVGVATYDSFDIGTAGTGDVLQASIGLNNSVVLAITATSNAFNVVPTASALAITGAPSATTTGAPFSLTVTASNALGTATHYTDTVHFTSTDTLAGLPSDYTFTSGDAGVHTFNGITLKTTGNQTITAADTFLTALTSTTGSISVTVPNFVVTVPTDDAGTATNCTPQAAGGTGTDASCSLRDAVLAASNAGAGNITFDHTAFATMQMIPLGSQIVLGDKTSITGPVGANGINLVTLSGGNTTRILSTNISGTNTMSLANLIFTAGNGAGDSTVGGGAILNGAHMTIANSTFIGNQVTGSAATSYSGGAILNNSHLTITGSTFTNNFVTPSAGSAQGGAIGNNDSTLTVTNSTFTGNTALAPGSAAGGAISSGGGIVAVLTLKNVTISGNTSTTFTGVSAPSSQGTAAISNSIISGNSIGQQITTGYTDNGGNVINIPGIQLATLGTYGGQTPTLLPLPGSTAICAGTVANASGILTDQRGVPRTTSYGAPPVACVDAGAVQTHYTIAFTQDVSNVVQNVAMSPAPTVSISEQGSPINLNGVSISVALSSGTGSLSGGSATTTGGAASYPALKLDTVGNNDQLTARLTVSGSPSLSVTATSSNFNVLNGVTQLAFGTAPSANVTAGGNAGSAITVKEEDSTGNTVTTAPAVSITLTVSGPNSYAKTYNATSSNGVATFDTSADVLNAAGTYSYTATLGGVTSANASATVGAAAAATITVSGGSGQSAVIGAAFTTPLAVKVVDSFSNPVSGAIVTFTAPSTGAASTFSTTAATATDGTTSVTATANGNAGSYSVSAGVAGVANPASFSLTNNKADTTTSITPTPTSVTYGQSVSIGVQVSPSNVAGSQPTGTVIFTEDGSTITPDGTLGSAAVTYTIPALAAGNHSFTAKYNGDSNFNASPLAAASNAVTVSKASSSLTPSKTSDTLAYNAGDSFTVTVAGQFSGLGVSTPTGNVTYTIAGGAPQTAAITTGVATITIPTTQSAVTGASIVISYAGDGNYNAATNASVSLTINQATPTITWNNPADITYGTLLSATQLNATATGVSGALNGVFLYSPASGTKLDAGNNQQLTATFTPFDTTDYTTATKTVSINVLKAAQAITFTAASPVTYGVAPITLSATDSASLPVTFTVVSGPGSISGNTLTVTGAGSIVVAADQAGNTDYSPATEVQQTIVVNKAPATVNFGNLNFTYDGNPHAATATTSPSGLTANFTYNTLSTVPTAAGSYAVVATINDANYTGSASGTEIISAAAPTITWSPASPIAYGTTLTAELNAQAKFNGNNVAGTYAYLNGATTVTAVTVLPAGNYTLTANFTPTDTTTYTAATAQAQIAVSKATAGIVLTSSVNPLTVQNATILTATVSSTVSIPTGTVTFLAGTTPLGTVALTNGVATLSVSTLAVGSHSLTATYAGDANFLGGASTAVTEQVSDFTLNFPGSLAATIQPGQTATFNFTVSPSGSSTFPQGIQFTISGLPPGATYTFTPPSIAAGAGSTNVALAITVPPSSAKLNPPKNSAEKYASFALAILLLPFAAAMRRKAGKLPKLVAMLLLLLGSAAGIAGLTGCGGGVGNGFFDQQQKTYTLTITATSGQDSHSTTATLTVE